MNKPTHILTDYNGFTHKVYIHEEFKQYSDGNSLFKPKYTYSLVPIVEPQEETFGWKEAMKLLIDGVKVEIFHEGYKKWEDFDFNDRKHLTIYGALKYRRKPVAPKPDYSLDQGFKEGDIVMVSDYRDEWMPVPYKHYYNETHYSIFGSPWKHARPLTKSEYERVKVEEV